MSLRLELEGYEPQRYYYPGQEIRGNVIFQLAKQRKILSASITFRGKIDTEHIESRRTTAGNTHGPRARAHEVMRLFEYSHSLFRGPFDVPPQTLSWPFAFTIPTHVEHRRVGNNSPGFIPDGITSLPPSYNWEDHTFTHDSRARIKYKLVAYIDSGGLFKNEETELPIPIYRYTTLSPPTPQILKHEFFPSQCWSSRDLRNQPHTLKQKLKHITSSDPELKTPCIAFKAYVHFPLQLAPHQKTAIAFSILHHRVTPNDPESPDLILDALRLNLKSHTAMTAARSGFGGSFSLMGDRYCEGRNPEAGKTLSFAPARLSLTGEELYLSNDVCLADWRQSTLPFMGDFETYTIKRAHVMKVEADVRHLPTGHVFQLRTEFRFAVLDEQLPGSGVARVKREEAVDGELPAYDEDVRPPDAGGRDKAEGEVLSKS